MMTVEKLIKLFDIKATELVNPTTGLLHYVRIHKKNVAKFYYEDKKLYGYSVCGIHKRVVGTREEAIKQMAQALLKYYKMPDELKSITEKILQQSKQIDSEAHVENVFEANVVSKQLDVTYEKVVLSNNRYFTVARTHYKEHGHVFSYNNINFVFKDGRKKKQIKVDENFDSITALIKLNNLKSRTGIDILDLDETEI